jgi:hypothetical protein
MKKTIDKKKPAKAKPCIYNELNAHIWATKMEIRRQLSAKPDLKR